MRSLALLALLAPLVAGTAACGTRTGREPSVPGAGTIQTVDPTQVSESQFAASAYQVLLSGEQSQQRANLLAGVVQRQLARSGARFKGAKREAGLSALTGALYLIRQGELSPVMFRGAAPSLRAGAAEVARVGNEGRSQALYSMLRSVLAPGAERDDVDAHLAALSRWTATTGSGSAMQSAGALQRAAVQRALFEPSPQTVEAARAATTSWIKRALELNSNESVTAANFEREEAVEAYRAVRAGGATLAALYLRFGDAKAAMGALEKGDLLKVVPPGLIERLERAANDDDPGAWADLFQLFSNAENTERPETSLDVELARAAAWGVSVELYRSEPRSLRGAAPLATQLVEYGMAEVAPLVMAPALGESPSAQDLSWALSLTLRAVLAEDEINEHAAARRTFEGARPILELAGSRQLAGKVRPTPARLHYVMGALETRAGDLGKARPHIEAAAKSEPSVEAFSMLAAIDRQRGDAKSALASLDRMAALARKAGDLSSETEALINSFEIHRDLGRAAEAKTSLDTALGRALKAREAARSGADQARAERVLARVLEHFGAAQGAKRATARAYEASRADNRQLTATVLDAARRALILGDLSTARQAVRQAIEADLQDEDLVYAALWLRLLEQKLGGAGDGTAEEAFAAVDDDAGWSAKLAAWGRGKISDEQLVKSARTRVQQTEAKFYTAMSRRVKGEAEALRQLREVAASEAIELVEVAIARDLVARESPLGVKLPDNVAVP